MSLRKSSHLFSKNQLKKTCPSFRNLVWDQSVSTGWSYWANAPERIKSPAMQTLRPGMHFGNFSLWADGVGKNSGYGFLSHIPDLPGWTSKLGVSLEISQEDFVVFMFWTDSKLLSYILHGVVQSQPPVLIGDFCNHQCPNNKAKVEQSLFLASVASSLILKICIKRLREAGKEVLLLILEGARK